MLGGQDGGDMVAGTTAGCKPAAPTVRTTQKTKLSMYACMLTRVKCIFVYMFVNTHVRTYAHMYIHMYLYPSVGVNYGWIKEKCADICDVAQVTDIRTLPN